ncbi:hypothetical protein KAK06_15925 [Ideonella sp. 4Y11]|uniref:ParB/Sulfiredoxin domain-containing protein n=1 Tax=Ideonella aquatica TaxID=2824119 RepID=A0A940YM29_9BURK|nr:hypothetical protein [Ideonella aquatica]MBQ0960441.1 hypothetical protein [Ideonella aquatica]
MPTPFGAASPDSLGPPGKTPSRAQRDEAEFKASYAVGDTAPSKIDLRRDLPGPMLLKSVDIVRYDHNPRLYANEKREDIRHSLKANGYQGTLQVTRRHAGEPYMLAAGSNTTLELLQELYAQTGDERFLWVNCIYQPYQGETTLLSQHLGENLNRGDMKFWEVAVGMCELLGLIEEERRQHDPGAKPMAVREASEALAARGLKADKSLVTIWRFATSRLAPLGSASAHLTHRGVQGILQPRLNALLALATRLGMDEAAFWDDLVAKELRLYATSAHDVQAFDPHEVADQVEAALAERASESIESVRHMLSLLKLNPKLTMAELRQPSPNLVAAPTASSASGPLQDSASTGQPVRHPVEHPVAQPVEPPPSQQRPLNLTTVIQGPPPGAGTGALIPSARSGLVEPQGDAARPATGATGTPRASVGPLFSAGVADRADPLGALHSAVDELLATAGLSDVLRWRDEMPLGFYLDLPDRQAHRRQTVQIGSPQDQTRTMKTIVWWSLTTISGQWLEGAVDCIDHTSTFYRSFSVEREESPLEGTDIEPVQPEPVELLMARVTPGLIRPAMTQLRAVEELAATVMEQLPERWMLLQKLLLSGNPY